MPTLETVALLPTSKIPAYEVVQRWHDSSNHPGTFDMCRRQPCNAVVTNERGF